MAAPKIDPLPDPKPDQIVDGEFIKGRHEMKDKHPEVHFPNVFTQEKPGDNPKFGPGSEFIIPIFRLSHCTHDKEAASIQASNYTFVPRMKLGKAYDWDGSPQGETYKCVGDNTFRYIARSYDHPVFPGNVSWWGIDTHYWYNNTDEGAVVRQNVLDNDRDRYEAPSYLQPATGSPYGNKCFSTTLVNLLSDYKQSRADTRGEVCLKVGGTLRYCNEICYVVFVCMENDDVGDMPNITGPIGPFDPNRLTNANGTVANQAAVPTITIQSIVKTYEKTKKENVHYDWEQLVFGLYFPAPLLRCIDIEDRDVRHNPPPCSSRRPPMIQGRGVKWVCPNTPPRWQNERRSVE